MLPKVHLTSHGRMSGSRWVITPLSLSRSWRSFFVQFFCVFLLLLGHTIAVLYCALLCMTCSLGISNFLEEITSLSHSIVFLYFFALITEEGFLISSCYSLELCIQMGISCFSPLPSPSLLFSAICKMVLLANQRNGVGMDVVGEFRMGGTHVHLWLIHVNVW